LTGGIASGKSTVSAILREHGAYIIDTDKIAHDIVAPGCPAWKEVVNVFGPKILLPDNSIDRKKLGNMVFRDEMLRSQLENITHPKIKEHVCQAEIRAQESGHSVVVLDVPLLIEAGWKDRVDAIWVVYVDEPTQLRRLQRRGRFTTDEALARIKSQMPLQVKLQYADVVIDNNGSVAHTAAQVAHHWQEALAKASCKKSIGNLE
jgi:dephospho-CoA kinase